MTLDGRRPTTEDRRRPAVTSPTTSDKHSRRNVWAFGFTSLFNDTASEMAYWILPAFLVSLGAGPATLGLIEGIAESVASLAKLLSGYITDRVQRRKPLVVAGYAVANVAKPLLAIASAWWHVLFVRFADRLSKGVRGTPRDVMLAESLPKDSSAAGSGFSRRWIRLGRCWVRPSRSGYCRVLACEAFSGRRRSRERYVCWWW